jgi:hypothetical protein
MAKAVWAALLIGLLASSGVKAGGSVEGATVVLLSINRDYPNIVFIRLSASTTGYPACYVFNPTWMFTLSLNGTNGKEMYATLLAAAASGKQIYAYGAGACNEHGQIESLNAMHFAG